MQNWNGYYELLEKLMVLKLNNQIRKYRFEWDPTYDNHQIFDIKL